jgi:hypothetical protein
MGRVVHGASCPCGELSLGQVVHGASGPWGKLSMGRNDCGARCRGVSLDGASFDGASGPGTLVPTRITTNPRKKRRKNLLQRKKEDLI